MKLPKRFQPLTNMSVYAVSLFITKGISLLMLPLMANYLTPAQLGELELLASTSVFACLLVGMAMHENLYRFAGAEKEYNKQFSIVSEIYSVSLIVSLIFVTILTLIALYAYQYIPFLSPTQLILLLTVVAIESALAISLGWLRLKDKATLFFQISVSTVILQIALVIPVLFWFADVTLIFATGVFSALVRFVILHKINGFTLIWPSNIQWKKYLAYSTPIMLSGIVAFSLNGAERWFIALSSDIETLGLYAIAAKFSLAMCILMQPFGMWWMPKRFHYLDNVGLAETTRINQYGFVYLCILAVSVAWISKLFILMVLPEIYVGAAELVAATITIALCKELAELTNIGILYSRKTRLLLVINIISMAIGLVLIYLLHSFHIWGVLFGVGMAQLVRLYLCWHVSQQLITLPYDYIHTLSLLITTFAAVWAIHLMVSPIHTLIGVVIAPTIIGLTAYWLRLTPTISLNQYAFSAVKRLFG